MKALALVKTNEMSHEEWLQARKKGIGGSDAAAVAGVNPYKTKLQVYLEKTGQLESVKTNEAMYWGTELEPVVAQEFQKRTGLKVWRRNAILQHSEHKWMLANIDRRVVGRNEGLECKTSSEYRKEDWEDNKVPKSYYLQCQHYMAVTGYNAWWIAVLIGGNKFRYKRIERDEDIIKYLISIEKDFWELVKKRIPPKIDGSEASSKLLKRMYPHARRSSSINLPDGAKELINKRQYHHEKENDHKEKRKEAENKLKNLLGNNEIGLIEGEEVVTWKNIESTRFKKTQLKKEHPDLYSDYTYKSIYRRLQVK